MSALHPFRAASPLGIFLPTTLLALASLLDCAIWGNFSALLCNVPICRLIPVKTPLDHPFAHACSRSKARRWCLIT
jgi:hypothetical protein